MSVALDIICSGAITDLVLPQEENSPVPRADTTQDDAQPAGKRKSKRLARGTIDGLFVSEIELERVRSRAHAKYSQVLASEDGNELLAQAAFSFEVIHAARNVYNAGMTQLLLDRLHLEKGPGLKKRFDQLHAECYKTALAKSGATAVQDTLLNAFAAFVNNMANTVVG